MTDELTKEDKKLLIDAMGQGMGEAIKEATEKAKKEADQQQWNQ